MSVRSIVPDEARYEVTPEGRAAASAEESCPCRLENVDGWLICCYCGTGYKTARPQAVRPTEKWRS